MSWERDQARSNEPQRFAKEKLYKIIRAKRKPTKKAKARQKPRRPTRTQASNPAKQQDVSLEYESTGTNNCR